MQSLNRQKFPENHPQEYVLCNVYYVYIIVLYILYCVYIIHSLVSLYLLAYNTKPIALLRILGPILRPRKTWHRKVFLFLFFFISAFHIISSIGIEELSVMVEKAGILSIWTPTSSFKSNQ